jgi:hypothetical protein
MSDIYKITNPDTGEEQLVTSKQYVDIRLNRLENAILQHIKDSDNAHTLESKLSNPPALLDKENVEDIYIPKSTEPIKAEEIKTDGWIIRPDQLGNKIVYLLRNPVAAKMRCVPHGYRWSSANLMFSDSSTILASAKRVSDFSLLEMRRKMNSHIPLPPEWCVLADGQIWSGNYVDVELAEAQYQTIANFMYLLNDRKVDQESEAEYVSYSVPDADVRFRAVELCMEYFRKERISICSGPERLTVVKVLRKEMGCGAKQLGRVLRLSSTDLQQLV